MARRANGIDLSETFIIVDYFSIKNTSSLQIFYFAHVGPVPNIIRDDESTC